MHDWTRVYAGIFHAFHQGWITELAASLNSGLLPEDYYALQEQQAAGFGPDVLTLQGKPANGEDAQQSNSNGGLATLPDRPQTLFLAESKTEFYRRKKSSIVVRHVSGDRMVAVLEVVSPGNKSSRQAFRAFLDKACELLENRIHLLLLDPFPPGKRDPNGIHAAIWAEVEDEPFVLPKEKPLTLVAYECDLTTRAFIQPIGVGEALPDMPLYVEPNYYVMAPLEKTYQAAFSHMPRRWRDVLDAPA
jgi:hypothetical protein